MRTKRIFSMFLTLILTVSILFSGIKLTSYAQSGNDLKMENDWGIQATKIKEYVKQLSEIEKQKEIKIAVLDTYFNDEHEIFNDKKVIEYDTSYNNTEECNGTGTFVAGIIANALDGMNYKIIPYNIAEDSSKSPSKFKDAINKAVEFGCDVIHLSYNSNYSGDDNGDQCLNGTLDKAIDDALKSGNKPCIVAGAGNNSSSETYRYCPAHIEEIIVVGSAKLSAIDSSGNNIYNKSDNSNFGKYVDFYAPGENVISAEAGSKEGYIEDSSTYAAAAFVTAMAAIYKAIYKAQNKDLTCGKIEKEIDSISISMEVDTNTGEKRKFPTFKDKIKDKEPIKEPIEDPIPPLSDYSDVYRLYNPNLGEHYYTTNKSEAVKLEKLGWKNEGIKWQSPKKYVDGAVGVFKLYNSKTGRHLFTLNTDEIKKLKSSGWKVEDKDGNDNIDTPVFYSIGTIPIYRVCNPNNGDHLLTAYWNEADKLIKAGWKDEKIGMWTPKIGEKNA